jgi:hypothetical protein
MAFPILVASLLHRLGLSDLLHYLYGNHCGWTLNHVVLLFAMKWNRFVM